MPEEYKQKEKLNKEIIQIIVVKMLIKNNINDQIKYLKEKTANFNELLRKNIRILKSKGIQINHNTRRNKFSNCTSND